MFDTVVNQEISCKTVINYVFWDCDMYTLPLTMYMHTVILIWRSCVSESTCMYTAGSLVDCPCTTFACLCISWPDSYVVLVSVFISPVISPIIHLTQLCSSYCLSLQYLWIRPESNLKNWFTGNFPFPKQDYSESSVLVTRKVHKEKYTNYKGRSPIVHIFLMGPKFSVFTYNFHSAFTIFNLI